MTTDLSVCREAEKVSPESSEGCIHCSNGWVYEPTEDSLTDEAYVCWMCRGTERR
jgi:hypothetical protein